MRKTGLGTYERYVEIDIEDVLDEVSTEDLEAYLDKRKGKEDKRTGDDAKDTILELCMGKVRRNMENDKEEVRSAINKVIDELYF